jgi:hypothetical protein
MGEVYPARYRFWAARRLQAFTDDMLNAVIRVGQFNDPKSEVMLPKCLIERRAAIVRRYLLPNGVRGAHTGDVGARNKH